MQFDESKPYLFTKEDYLVAVAQVGTLVAKKIISEETVPYIPDQKSIVEMLDMLVENLELAQGKDAIVSSINDLTQFCCLCLASFNALDNGKRPATDEETRELLIKKYSSNL